VNSARVDWKWFFLSPDRQCPPQDVFPIHVEPASQTVRRSSSTATFEMGSARIYINDVTFTDYHVFRSESRILFDENR
jgi:hypothetical protein